MNIEHGIQYRSFRFTYQDVEWTIQGPLTGDLVAGLMLGVLLSIIETEEELHRTDILIEVIGEGDLRLMMTYDDIIPALDYFYIMGYENLHQQDNPPYDNLPRTGEYGWWINIGGTDHLFSFETAEFVRGVISMLRGFHVDLQQLKYEGIIGKLFTYDRKTKHETQYRIQT